MMFTQNVTSDDRLSENLTSASQSVVSLVNFVFEMKKSKNAWFFYIIRNEETDGEYMVCHCGNTVSLIMPLFWECAVHES